MDENWLKKLALDFSSLTEQPAYFYDMDNWLYKAHNGEVKRVLKSEPEKVEATIAVYEAERYLEEIK